jgi:hypothetical protein
MGLSKEVIATLTKEQKRYYKAHGTLPPSDASVTSSHETSILCVKYGSKYGLEYLERLRNMIARNITVPYKLFCLTDDPRSVEGVHTIHQPSAGYSKLWWQKVHMFDPRLPLQGRILYFDLDVVICGNIDKMTQNLGNNFMGIQDFNRKFYPSWKMLNSSVMSWVHGEHSEIWFNFNQNPKVAMRMHGDQDWIWAQGKNKIKFWPKEWIQSYKWEVRSREELVVRNGTRGFKSVNHDVQIPNGCSVMVFHGEPNPADVQDKIVVENWK